MRCSHEGGGTLDREAADLHAGATFEWTRDQEERSDVLLSRIFALFGMYWYIGCIVIILVPVIIVAPIVFFVPELVP